MPEFVEMEPSKEANKNMLLASQILQYQKFWQSTLIKTRAKTLRGVEYTAQKGVIKAL